MKLISLAASLVLATSLVFSPHASASSVAAAPSAGYIAPLPKDSWNVFAGSTIGWGKEKLLLSEFQLGLNQSQELVPVFFVGHDSAGRLHRYDVRAKALKVFGTPEEIRGCFFVQAGQRVWVESLRLGMTSGGRLSTLQMSGLNAEGAPFSIDNLFDTPQCACVWSATCGSGTCSKPREKCLGQDPPCEDLCSGVSGECSYAIICECPVESTCPASEDCRAVTSGMPACECTN